MNESTAGQKPFRILDLPQEIQDKIITYAYLYAYDTRTLELSYAGRPTSANYRGRRPNPRPLRFRDYSNWNLLMVNKRFAKSVRAIQDVTPIKLTIANDEEKGFTALQVLSSRGPRYDAIRAKVISADLRGINRDNGAGNLTHYLGLLKHTRLFPKLEKVTICYSATRRALDGNYWEDGQETAEFKKVWKIKDGSSDEDMVFPVDLFDLRGKASMIEETNDKLELFLETTFAWNASGRGIWCWSVSCMTYT